MVSTAVGLIERDRLVVEDIITEAPNQRTIVTEWRLDGEIVKQDTHVSILCGQAIFGKQEEL